MLNSTFTGSADIVHSASGTTLSHYCDNCWGEVRVVKGFSLPLTGPDGEPRGPHPSVSPHCLVGCKRPLGMGGSLQGQSTPGFRKGAPLSLGSDSLPVPTVQQKDSLACASQPQFPLLRLPPLFPSLPAAYHPRRLPEPAWLAGTVSTPTDRASGWLLGIDRPPRCLGGPASPASLAH